MEITPEMLTQLNTYTRRDFTADEVYIFKVRLCDNDIDRDGERFSLEALSELCKLFVGKTGIFDHNPKGENQNARIFRTELETDEKRTTAAGEPYTSLCGYAYMVRTDGNSDLIREIDGGIKKEVSISCSAKKRTCSVCGKDRTSSPCTHMPFHDYRGKTCHVVLSDITDAYEWSFVAVPAQRNAGVTKRYDESGIPPVEDSQLFHCQKLLRDIEERTRREVVSLHCCSGGSSAKAFAMAAARMDLEELLILRDSLMDELEPRPLVQLEKPADKSVSNLSEFCIG